MYDCVYHTVFYITCRYLGDGRFHLESIMISNPSVQAYRYRKTNIQLYLKTLILIHVNTCSCTKYVHKFCEIMNQRLIFYY